MKGLYYLCAAYTAVWVAIFAYVLSVGRRTGKLERELEELRK